MYLEHLFGKVKTIVTDKKLCFKIVKYKKNTKAIGGPILNISSKLPEYVFSLQC